MNVQRASVSVPVIVLVLATAGCATTPSPASKSPAEPARTSTARDPAVRATPPPPPAARTAPRRGGAFYLDDGPGDGPPPDLAHIPDAEPRIEPLHRFANRPYVVFGRGYTPMTERVPYTARGVATWYGKRYHARKTSSGEVYDMYAMTGAHPTLPIPSYVRVTHVANGRSVIIRINDRGPFIGERLIDLSYAAAFRLGYVEAGSATVEVEKLIPGVNWPLASATLASKVPLAATVAVTAVAAPPHQTAELAGTEPAGAPIAATPTAVSLPAEAGHTPITTAADLPPRAGTLPLAAGSTGFFLQLGAFADRANAETFLMRIRPELGGNAGQAHVFPGPKIHRVHIGPFASEALARSAAEQLTHTLNIKPLLTVR